MFERFGANVDTSESPCFYLGGCQPFHTWAKGGPLKASNGSSMAMVISKEETA
jgi:hypothetical protein